MWQRNSGQKESDILQNRFTSYLVTAIQRRKWDYINQQNRLQQLEVSTEYSILEDLIHSKKFVYDWTNTLAELENDSLICALKQISGREKHVFLGRVLEEKSFEELAEELGLSYKGAAALYYRSIKKIKDKMKEIVDE